MKIAAVIDTNVIVSAFLSRMADAATVQVFQHFMNRKLTLLYNDEILDEYRDVLSRPKFNIDPGLVRDLMDFIHQEGVASSRVHSDEIFLDPNDVVFYEVAVSQGDAYLVTGNIKHFPRNPIVVTPAEMLEILNSQT